VEGGSTIRRPWNPKTRQWINKEKMEIRSHTRARNVEQRGKQYRPGIWRTRRGEKHKKPKESGGNFGTTMIRTADDPRKKTEGGSFGEKTGDQKSRRESRAPTVSSHVGKKKGKSKKEVPIQKGDYFEDPVEGRRTRNANRTGKDQTLRDFGRGPCTHKPEHGAGPGGNGLATLFFPTDLHGSRTRCGGGIRVRGGGEKEETRRWELKNIQKPEYK